MTSILRIRKKIAVAAISWLVFFAVVNDVFSQTPEQEKFYAERIEFGEIDVKRNALFDLRNFETAAASRIATPALKDVSSIVRATATHSVIYLPKNEAAAYLLPLLSDVSPFVRRETAYALGKVGSPNALALLTKTFSKEKDREVKSAIVTALGQIGDVSAIQTLSRILLKKRKSKDEFLRRMTARAVGNIARQIQRQKKPIVTPGSFLPENFKTLKRPKYRRLFESFPTFIETNAALVKILQNPKESDDVRREAAFALGEIGDRSSIEPIKSFTSAKEYYLAEICKESLRKVYQNVNFANSDSY